MQSRRVHGALGLLLLFGVAHAEDDQPRLALGNDGARELSVTWNRAVDAAGFVEHRAVGGGAGGGSSTRQRMRPVVRSIVTSVTSGARPYSPPPPRPQPFWPTAREASWVTRQRHT